MSDVESLLLLIKECFVYKIPTRSSNRGFRADEWNVNQWIWSGRLKIYTKSNQCFIRLEDVNTGELFAISPYNMEENTVEPVVDSSRYFVLRVEDGNGRHAFIGIGFSERSEAFDFNAALLDFTKRNQRQKEVESLPQQPCLDYRLKQGEKMHIAIPSLDIQPSKRHEISSASPSSFQLPPPPTASENGEFGEYVSANSAKREDKSLI